MRKITLLDLLVILCLMQLQISPAFFEARAQCWLLFCQAAFQLGGPAHPAVGLLLPRALRCVGLHEVPVTPRPPGCLCRAEQASSWSVQKDTDPHGITWMGHIIFLVIWPGGGQGELQTVVDPCMLLVCAGALSTVSLEPQLMWLLLPRPWVSESPNPQFVFPVHPQRH